MSDTQETSPAEAAVDSGPAAEQGEANSEKSNSTETDSPVAQDSGDQAKDSAEEATADCVSEEAGGVQEPDDAPAGDDAEAEADGPAAEVESPPPPEEAATPATVEDGDAAFAGASSAAQAHNPRADRTMGPTLQVQARRAQQRHVTEFAASLQAASVWSSRAVDKLEKQRSSRGRAQDVACSVYWRSWMQHMSGACDGHRELVAYMGSHLEQLEALMHSHDAQREVLAFLPTSARVVLREGRKREGAAPGKPRVVGEGNLPSPTAPGEQLPKMQAKDECSSLDAALHGLAATMDDSADGLAHLVAAFKAEVMGYNLAEVSTVLSERARATSASRSWLGLITGESSGGLKAATGGGLLGLLEKYDAAAKHIAESGSGASQAVASINGMVDSAEDQVTAAMSTMADVALKAVAHSNAATVPHGPRFGADTPSDSNSSDSTPVPVASALPKAGKYSNGIHGIAQAVSEDPWLPVLAHCRAHVALLSAKKAYLKNMRQLFETMRQAEQERTDVLSSAISKWHELQHRTYGQLAGNVKPRAVLARDVDTFKDFLAYVEAKVHRDLGPRVKALIPKQSPASSPAADEAGAAAGGKKPAAAGGSGSETEIDKEDINVMALLTVPPPPVPSPLLNPLVFRWGVVERQLGGLSGFMGNWAKHVAVLTRGGYLHLFDCDADVLASEAGLLASPVAPWDPAPQNEAEQEHNKKLAEVSSAVCRGKHGEYTHDDTMRMAKAAQAAPHLSLALGQAAVRGGGVVGSTSHLGSHGGVSVQFTPSIHECAFEVAVGTPGMLFSSTKKVVLRCASQPDMVDWVVAIHEVSDGAAGIASLLLQAEQVAADKAADKKNSK